VVDDDARELRLLRDRVQEVSHDLANVLGIALNYTAFLVEDLADAATEGPVGEHLPQIEAAARRAVELVRELQAAVPPTRGSGAP
jgi:signal transduction histidine kinase